MSEAFRVGSVLVTGANGFVGREVCGALAAAGLDVRAAVRSDAARARLPAHPQVEPVIVGALASDTDWSCALAGIGIVVHLAARVHVMSESAADPERAFQAVNVDASLALARQAHSAGVRRFIYMSSVKVNGERTGSQPFRADDPPAPEDPYARSKRDAETQLLALADRDFEVAVVRPPLVYGAGVGANFRALLALAASGAPLPFGAIRNARSLISVWNLADFVRALAASADPICGVWLVSDGEDLSTPELVRRLARALGRTPRVFALPVVILRACAALIGKAAEMRRLTDSLQIDSRSSAARLRWAPSVSLDDGLARTARAWLQERSGAGAPRA